MSDDFQSTPPAPVAPPPVGGDVPSDTGKILAGFGYLVGIVALIAILMEPYKNEPFVRQHAIQALALWVISIVLGIVANIPVIGWILGMVVGIAVLVFAIIGAIKAFQGQTYEMPVVYNLVKQYI